jgi:hypothetical protein
MIRVDGGPKRWFSAVQWLLERNAEFRLVVWEATVPESKYRTFRWDEPFADGKTVGQQLTEMVYRNQIHSKGLDFLVDDEETAILFKLTWCGDGDDLEIDP